MLFITFNLYKCERMSLEAKQVYPTGLNSTVMNDVPIDENGSTVMKTLK